MSLVFLIINILIWIIIIDALLTWIPSVDRRNPIVTTLRSITDPIYKPIRRLIPPEKTGYIDLSPLIAVVALQLIGMILQSIL